MKWQPDGESPVRVRRCAATVTRGCKTPSFFRSQNADLLLIHSISCVAQEREFQDDGSDRKHAVSRERYK